MEVLREIINSDKLNALFAVPESMEKIMDMQILIDTNF